MRMENHINPTTCSYSRPRRLPTSQSAYNVHNCCDTRAYRKPVISICKREVVCPTRQANLLVQFSLPPLWGPFSRASLAPAPPCQALLTFLASYRPKRLRLVTQRLSCRLLSNRRGVRLTRRRLEMRAAYRSSPKRGLCLHHSLEAVNVSG